MIRRLINRLFRLEEINGRGVCPTYLFRWRLLKLPGLSVYLHKFVGDDWSRDLHDHPKRFISIGLRGRYIEETPIGELEFLAPWFRSFPATHIHRIRMRPGETCWTIAIALRAVRPWGFWHRGNWVPWREYVDSPRAEERRACP